MGSEMKTCPDCNTENTINAKFCTACGIKLEESIHPVELIQPIIPAQVQIVGQAVLSEKIPELKVRTHVLFFAYCESIWDLLKNSFRRKHLADRLKSEKILKAKSDSVDQALSVGAEALPEPKISKLILIKACIERAISGIHSKLQAIKSVRFNRSKKESVEEVGLVTAAESKGESDSSKIKRIMIVAGVAGITAVAASVGISWFINVAPQPPSVATKESSTAIDKPQNATQTFVPSPATVPAKELVQSKSTDIASAGPNVMTQSNAPFNSSVNQSTDAAQPIKKKQSTNQQDINRKRLLELKRQLGQ